MEEEEEEMEEERSTEKKTKNMRRCFLKSEKAAADVILSSGD